EPLSAMLANMSLAFMPPQVNLQLSLLREDLPADAATLVVDLVNLQMHLERLRRHANERTHLADPRISHVTGFVRLQMIRESIFIFVHLLAHFTDEVESLMDRFFVMEQSDSTHEPLEAAIA